MKHLILWALLLAAGGVQAQYAGGPGRGDAAQLNDALALDGEDLNVLFSGGSGNGQTRSATSLILLPITLLRFDGRADGSAALLSWTALADPGETFELQRSNRPGQWSTVVVVSAQGDGQTARTYGYRDPAPGAGVQLYRLALRDNGGTVTYSNTLQLRFGAGGVQVAPTVTTGALFIEVAAPAKVSLLDAEGRTLDRFRLPQGRHAYSLQNRSAGLYLLRFDSGEAVWVIRR